MKKEVYFIRHAKPDYSKIDKNENINLPCFAPLSGEGRVDAKYLKDEINLIDKFIVVSPYTRALETAHQFIGTHPYDVDYNLHEWLPSKSFTGKVSDIAEINKEYKKNNGKFSEKYDYETKEEMKERVQKVIDYYSNCCDKIVLVCHARIIASFLDIEEPKYCQIIKYEFEI